MADPLLNLPSCPPLPAVDRLVAEGWEFHAAHHSADRSTGCAIVSRGQQWATARWATTWTSLRKWPTERQARNEHDRDMPVGAPRASRGS